MLGILKFASHLALFGTGIDNGRNITGIEYLGSNVMHARLYVNKLGFLSGFIGKVVHRLEI